MKRREKMPKLEILQQNFTKIELNDKLAIWFSYETPVALRVDDNIFISENVWSSTTGKHLNVIDGGAKASRMPHDDFEKKLSWHFMPDE